VDNFVHNLLITSKNLRYAYICEERKKMKDEKPGEIATGEETREKQSPVKTDLPDTQFIGPDGKRYWKDGHRAVKES
jgi:hypothetical protein